MGLLQQASLVTTPNAVKTGKLYSIVPTDGTGDLGVVRATTATRVNSDGLIEQAPYNLLQRSEEFENASWSKQNVSITANQALSPNGLLNAELLSGISTGTTYLYQNPTVVTGQPHTISIFAKKNQTNFLQIFGSGGFGSTTWANFDLENGVIGNKDALTNATITNYGNGWYRCTITNTTVSTLGGCFFIPVNSASATRNPSFNATDHSIYIWGAQLVTGTEPKEYLPTTDRLNVPRLDYTNGSCPSILVEPQRTNLITYSEEFENASWVKAVGTLVTSNTSLSPSGLNDADLVYGTNFSIGQNISATSGTYIFSVYLKATGSNIGKEVSVRFQNSPFPQTILTTNGEWQRISVTITIASTTTLSPRILIFGTTNPVSEILAWGAQLEAGSNATSYIPTVASAVTRNADVISKTGISDLIGQTEGTIFVDFNNTKTDSVSRYIYAISNGNSTDFNFEAIINASNALIISSRNNETTQTSYNYGSISLQKYKIAYSYSENNTRIFVNGVLVSVDTICTIPATDSVKLGMRSNNTVPLNDSINKLLLFKTQLTDEQCIALTTL